MNDVLHLLEQQTVQTETLITRLTERLTRTRELKTLEQERRQLTGKIVVFEQRLSALDDELKTLQEMSCEDRDDDAQAVVSRLEQAWADISAGGGRRMPLVSSVSWIAQSPVQAEIPLPLPPADLTPSEAGIEDELPDSPVVNDAIDVLDSFFSTAGDAGGGELTWDNGDFFSNAEGLKDEAGLDDDWWQTDPTGDSMPALEQEPLEPVLMEPPVTETNNQTARRGLLGRFF